MDIVAPKPTILPLGDGAVIVRFGDSLTDTANQAALALARRLEAEPIAGVTEVVPSLVSVLLRFDFSLIEPMRLAGEVALRLVAGADAVPGATHRVGVQFGDAGGPDLAEVAAALGLSPAAFVEAHCARPLRVLTTGFAPGFVYCGFHPPDLVLPRRTTVRQRVPVGSVLFAAGQTAITATDVPTGWHVIGRTTFRNFRPAQDPPTLLRAGDDVVFEVDR